MTRREHPQIDAKSTLPWSNSSGENILIKPPASRKNNFPSREVSAARRRRFLLPVRLLTKGHLVRENEVLVADALESPTPDFAPELDSTPRRVVCPDLPKQRDQRWRWMWRWRLVRLDEPWSFQSLLELATGAQPFGRIAGSNSRAPGDKFKGSKCRKPRLRARCGRPSWRSRSSS
jgi:hypothetical protein